VAYLEDCELTPGIEMRVVSQQCIKCEHCEDDDDLLTEIARAKILLPCLGEKPDSEPTREPEPQPNAESIIPKTKSDQLHEKALKGDIKSQLELGWAYYNGNGVKQSYEEAAQFWF
jgi:TPR repeat protein